MAELLVQDTSLTAIANAIRAKAESTGALAFPGGFVDAISALVAFPEGVNAIASGTYTPTQNTSSIVTIQHGMNVMPNFAFILPEPVDINEEDYENCQAWQIVFDQNHIHSDGIGSGDIYYRASGTGVGSIGGSGSVYDTSKPGYNATVCRFYGSSGYDFKAGVTYRWFAANLTRT